MTNAPQRRIALICAKAGLDEAYPALILANAARASGIDASIFFTFYGLNVITEKKVDHLHVSMVGNTASPMPHALAGLPGMDNVATAFMKKKMKELDVPDVREMVQQISDAGCRIFACELAMKMMDLELSDLLPQVDGVLTAEDFYKETVGADIVFC
jgi:peroxiredoxin family protein